MDIGAMKLKIAPDQILGIQDHLNSHLRKSDGFPEPVGAI